MSSYWKCLDFLDTIASYTKHINQCLAQGDYHRAAITARSRCKVVGYFIEHLAIIHAEPFAHIYEERLRVKHTKVFRGIHPQFSGTINDWKLN